MHGSGFLRCCVRVRLGELHISLDPRGSEDLETVSVPENNQWGVLIDISITHRPITTCWGYGPPFFLAIEEATM